MALFAHLKVVASRKDDFRIHRECPLGFGGFEKTLFLLRKTFVYAKKAYSWKGGSRLRVNLAFFVLSIFTEDSIRFLCDYSALFGKSSPGGCQGRGMGKSIGFSISVFSVFFCFFCFFFVFFFWLFVCLFD